MFVASQPPAISVPSAANDQDVIEIVGRRSDQALKIDRRTYRVQTTPHSQQKDAIQLLRGLPAVTVSPDEDINLLGSGNVTIFVDGRPYQGDAKAYLRTLHGSDIERIEIITNPSAQYSAEGTGGIINFVLRKKRADGASGTFTTEFSSLVHGYLNATLKAKHGKWTYELHAGGRAGRVSDSSYHKLRSIEETPGGPATINSEDGGGPYRGAEAEASAKLSYELSPRTTVSARVLAGKARDPSRSRAQFAGLTPDFQSFTEDQHFTTTATFLISELNLDHKGAKEGETLNANLRIFGNPSQHEANSATFSNGGALTVDKLKHFLFANAAIDWQHPMGKGQILSVGGSWDYNRMSERYRFTSIGSGGDLGMSASDQFRGVEDKLAAYATFQQPVGSWTFMPGLRIEHDGRHIASPGEPDVRIARTDIFPTLHVDHPLSSRLDLTLSYSKRIDRPQLNDLRPYPLVQDVLTIKEGNPRLKDQSTDSYEVNLHYRYKKVDAGVILYDRETSDIWRQSYSVVGGVNVFTFVNAGRSRDRGAEIDVGTPIVGRTKINATVNLFDERAPADARVGSAIVSTFRYNTNTTLEWNGPDRGGRPGDVAQLQWGYDSPSTQFQFHYFASSFQSLSYTHSFSRTFSLTGSINHLSHIRHQLYAPLVQEYYEQRSPVEFKLKFLKTFGKP